MRLHILILRDAAKTPLLRMRLSRHVGARVSGEGSTERRILS
jgi:hypothetical protein